MYLLFKDMQMHEITKIFKESWLYTISIAEFVYRVTKYFEMSHLVWMLFHSLIH